MQSISHVKMCCMKSLIISFILYQGFSLLDQRFTSCDNKQSLNVNELTEPKNQATFSSLLFPPRNGLNIKTVRGWGKETVSWSCVFDHRDTWSRLKLMDRVSFFSALKSEGLKPSSAKALLSGFMWRLQKYYIILELSSAFLHRQDLTATHCTAKVTNKVN